MLDTPNRPSLKRNHDTEATTTSPYTVSPYFSGNFPSSISSKKQRTDLYDKHDNHNPFNSFSPMPFTPARANVISASLPLGSTFTDFSAFNVHNYIVDSDDSLTPVALPFQQPPTSYEVFNSNQIPQIHIDSATTIHKTGAPHPPNLNLWEDDITFAHSDDEEEDPDLTTPVPTTLDPTTSPKPTTKKSHLPCDPGIKRIATIDRSSTTRWILRFDPDIPRPEYARVPTFGHLPGLYIGKRWHSRMGASWDGTHTPTIAGIAGRSRVGAVSIALSGGYEDDFDEGYRFVYTGSGGRDLKVGKGARTGPQAKHQHWNSSNSALRMNIKTEKPVRVIRGRQGDAFWSPAEGFMYSGLYEVVACWTEEGKSGFDVIRFAFKRLPGQEPLINGAGEPTPEPDYDSVDWINWELWLTEERAEEIVAIKKEESPAPREASIIDSIDSDVTYIKIERDD